MTAFNQVNTIVLILLCMLSAAQADDILSTLRPGHPRLILLNDDLPQIKKNIDENPQAAMYYRQFQNDARAVTTQPVIKHVLVGPRLLAQSRSAFRRISTLAAMYRLDGDKSLAARARDEMLAAAAFDDWNPSHFLDVAEMTAALAIGYDWLYDVLSPQEREMIRAAIVEKGLRPGLHAYETGISWTRASHNWANVCAGGLTMGALAVADEEPDIARKILDATRTEMQRALMTMAPDGGNPEGPGYWNYATQYTAYYLAACESALGTDFGFKAMPGFAPTGWFRIHTTGPLGKAFNYADAAEYPGQAPQMFWLARAFDQQAFAVHERQFAGKWGEIFHLIWFDGRGESLKGLDAPLDAMFKRVSVICLRSAWDDPNAFYVGFKGGDNKANHSHLDLGTFVFDAFDQRWALDLGPDDYNLPGYFGKERFTYYHLRTEGHNTLTFDGANQDAKAEAPIVAYRSTPARAFAVADLSAAYPAAKRVRRGVELLDRRALLILDEIELREAAQIVWNMHTTAKIEHSSDATVATLQQGGATLAARILSPPDAKFASQRVQIPPPQRAVKGLSKLTVALPAKITDARIIVVLAAPDVANNIPMPPALDQWVADGAIEVSK